jgi:hypothetical protein
VLSGSVTGLASQRSLRRWLGARVPVGGWARQGIGHEREENSLAGMSLAVGRGKKEGVRFVLGVEEPSCLAKLATRAWGADLDHINNSTGKDPRGAYWYAWLEGLQSFKVAVCGCPAFMRGSSVRFCTSAVQKAHGTSVSSGEAPVSDGTTALSDLLRCRSNRIREPRESGWRAVRAKTGGLSYEVLKLLTNYGKYTTQLSMPACCTCAGFRPYRSSGFMQGIEGSARRAYGTERRYLGGKGHGWFVPDSPLTVGSWLDYVLRALAGG